MFYSEGFVGQRSISCMGLSAFVHSAALVAATLLPNAIRSPNEGTTQVSIVDFAPRQQTALGDSLDVKAAPVHAEEAAPKEASMPRPMKRHAHKKLAKKVVARALPVKKVSLAKAEEKTPEIETVEESPVILPVVEKVDAQPAEATEPIKDESPSIAQEVEATTPDPMPTPVKHIDPLVKPGPQRVMPNVHSQANGDGINTLNGRPVGGAPKGLPNGVRNADLLTETSGNVRPQYPIADRMSKRMGMVEFLAVVNSDGSVGNITLFGTTGTSEMVKNAFDAFKKWRYEPGQTGRIYKKFSFVLSGDTYVMPARLRTSR